MSVFGVALAARRWTCAYLGVGIAAIVVALVALVAPVGGAPSDPIGSPARFQAIEPCRIVDTRNPGSPGQVGEFAPNESQAYDVQGTRGTPFFLDQGAPGCTIPVKAVAVELTFTAVTPSGTGFVRAAPASENPANGATVLNYTSGVAPTNSVTVGLGVGCEGSDCGELAVRNYSGTTHLVIDVTGYYLQP